MGSAARAALHLQAASERERRSGGGQRVAGELRSPRGGRASPQHLLQSACRTSGASRAGKASGYGPWAPRCRTWPGLPVCGDQVVQALLGTGQRPAELSVRRRMRRHAVFARQQQARLQAPSTRNRNSGNSAVCLQLHQGARRASAARSPRLRPDPARCELPELIPGTVASHRSGDMPTRAAEVATLSHQPAGEPAARSWFFGSGRSVVQHCRAPAGVRSLAAAPTGAGRPRAAHARTSGGSCGPHTLHNILCRRLALPCAQAQMIPRPGG